MQYMRVPASPPPMCTSGSVVESGDVDALHMARVLTRWTPVIELCTASDSQCAVQMKSKACQVPLQGLFVGVVHLSATFIEREIASMALRRGFAGLVPRLLNTTEALAPICSSSSSLLQQADATPSSSGTGFGAYTSFLRSAYRKQQGATYRSSSSLCRSSSAAACCPGCRLCLRCCYIEAVRAVPMR